MTSTDGTRNNKTVQKLTDLYFESQLLNIDRKAFKQTELQINQTIS